MRVDTRSVPAHKHTYACASTQTVTWPCTSVSLPTPLPCPSPCLPLTASLPYLTRDPLSAQARDSASGGGVGAARGGVDDRGGVNSRGGVDQSDALVSTSRTRMREVEALEGVLVGRRMLGHSMTTIWCRHERMEGARRTVRRG